MSHGFDEGGLWGFASGPAIAALQKEADKYSIVVNRTKKHSLLSCLRYIHLNGFFFRKES